MKTGRESCQEHSCFLADSGKVVCIVTCRRATLISTACSQSTTTYVVVLVGKERHRLLLVVVDSGQIDTLCRVERVD